MRQMGVSAELLAARAEAEGRRVLLVDDEPDLVTILSHRFKATGFSVAEATDGASALQQLADQVPDAIVLDVNMPELNGFQVCRRLKSDSRTRNVPVVLLTAKDSDADKFWGREVGADLRAIASAKGEQVQ
jgi:DNA-binding response OmpR family regulator